MKRPHLTPNAKYRPKLKPPVPIFEQKKRPRKAVKFESRIIGNPVYENDFAYGRPLVEGFTGLFAAVKGFKSYMDCNDEFKIVCKALVTLL